ncbi:hypothetical protein A2164_02030 [Candidatus Curtissbacteria bacterium RBG_13_35_7]|uniref:Histidinol-phosphatase n=1 Tax=Candidatus Curtissbacteria bacterium RBG_13_35_7 TaxID=1797705 RepID=A0A1F5G2V1_9BACT|nr:MAG: hypothetical protein A2164_02030 [Candidatus Curtissbacteria bacterium RBG_13_35_7]
MIDVAIETAKKAGQLALKYYQTHPKVSYKADTSPVTKADIEAEKLARSIIVKNFPDHGIIGEELPNINLKSKYQWTIDPIDGTKLFIRGIPTWSTLIALLENGKPIIGVLYYPPIDELYVAQHAKGAFLNNKKIKVSNVSSFKHAFMSHNALKHFNNINKVKQLVTIANKCHVIRGYGDAYGYSLLASGKIDIFMEAYVAIHDIAAPYILIKEAGGQFTDFKGQDSITSGTSLATNGLLHEQVIKLLNKS